MSDAERSPQWYSIKAAAEYLNVGEPTLYRWMRDRKITFRKVGDSTRFWKEDLDAFVQVFPSAPEAEKVQAVCPFCHHDRLVEGCVQSTGLNYFRPKQTKFWTLKDINVDTHAYMCGRCGAVVWFGDVAKLNDLQREFERGRKSAPPPADEAPEAPDGPAA